MHLRRSFALTAGTALLAGLGLSSCGFDYATNEPYTPAAGTLSQEASVDVLSAVIVAKQDNAGTLVASLANNTQEEATLERVSGADGTPLQGEFEPVTIPPDGLVNLAVEGQVKVTGTFSAGDMLDTILTFGDGSEVNMRIPVYTACGYYEGLDTSGEEGGATEGGASPSESPAESPSESPAESPVESPAESPVETPAESPSGSAEGESGAETAADPRYSCEVPEAASEH